jgi:uncharacterized repeat protein (TIGR01451 family)
LPSAGSAEILYSIEAQDGESRGATPELHIRVEQEAAECEPKRPPVFWLALGAAGGAALGIAILSGGQEETGAPEPPAPSPPVIPPVEPPSPPALETVSACFDIPPAGEVGVPVRIDGSCSLPRGSIAYEWSLGDGRRRDGRVITPSYSAPGLYLVELRVVRLTGAASADDEDRLEKTLLIVEPRTPPDGPTADLAIEKLGVLSSRIVDGVLHFHISYTLTVSNRGSHTATRVTVRDSLMNDLTPVSSTPSQGTCSVLGRDISCLLDSLLPGARATVSLEVDVRPGVPENTSVANTAIAETATPDPAPANNRDTETTLLIRPPTLRSFEPFESTFVSTIETARRDGSASGGVRVNEGPLDSVNDATSYRHRARAASDEVLVEGSLQSAVQGVWRFDLGSDGRVIPGSIQVLEGQVLAREPLGIHFRLSGQIGERVRFTYRHRR